MELARCWARDSAAREGQVQPSRSSQSRGLSFAGTFVGVSFPAISLDTWAPGSCQPLLTCSLDGLGISYPTPGASLSPGETLAKHPLCAQPHAGATGGTEKHPGTCPHWQGPGDEKAGNERESLSP